MSTFRQYRSEIREHTESKTRLRDTVSHDVDDFVASGHTITQIPFGVGEGTSSIVDKPSKASRGGVAGAKMKRGRKFRAESYRRVQVKLNARAAAKGKHGHSLPPHG